MEISKTLLHSRVKEKVFTGLYAHHIIWKKSNKAWQEDSLKRRGQQSLGLQNCIYKNNFWNNVLWTDETKVEMLGRWATLKPRLSFTLHVCSPLISLNCLKPDGPTMKQLQCIQAFLKLAGLTKPKTWETSQQWLSVFFVHPGFLLWAPSMLT